ncbi:hypothetical protein ACQKLP_10680 [Chitinophaga sp. NPDC101104]|uniref:hypothetical protein n=1 Tax=Chitinophaga sp. NPDC101104 TaxID=3390561 RepID=UPI003D00A488
MAKLSPESLFKLRRLRKARFLWKKGPLMALATMQAQYPGYTQQMLIADLKPRSRKKVIPKTRSPLYKYGRYARMQQLIQLYHQTGDIQNLLEAQKLRKRLTAPYRVEVRTGNHVKEFYLPATTSYTTVVSLVAKINGSSSFETGCQIVEQFLSRVYMGN